MKYPQASVAIMSIKIEQWSLIWWDSWVHVPSVCQELSSSTFAKLSLSHDHVIQDPSCKFHGFIEQAVKSCLNGCLLCKSDGNRTFGKQRATIWWNFAQTLTEPNIGIRVDDNGTGAESLEMNGTQEAWLVELYSHNRLPNSIRSLAWWRIICGMWRVHRILGAYRLMIIERGHRVWRLMVLMRNSSGRTVLT